jgi:ABC-2 type transport system ATP-binding protein
VANDIIIKTENLTKYYGRLKALDNLTINVKEGITGFLGPNAAGKTTTIKILLGLLRQTSGKVSVLGMDPSKDPLKVRRNIGFVPENPKPYRYMNGWDFMDFIAKLKGIPAYERKKEINILLEKVGLLERAKSKIATYSRGMVQRLFIAQALLGEPKLIILDEPTAGLDPLGREEILNLLKELGKTGSSIFISSHILGEVERICNQVIIIDRGQLVLESATDKIKEEFASGRYKIKTDKPDNLLNELLQQSYVKEAWIEDGFLIVTPSNDRDFRRGIFELSLKLQCELFSLEKEMPSLQDVFVTLIKRKGGTIK